MDSKFKVGDKVRIKTEMFNNNIKRYTGVYEIEKIRKDFDDIYLYKLKGVPGWGTEDMIKGE